MRKDYPGKKIVDDFKEEGFTNKELIRYGIIAPPVLVIIILLSSLIDSI